MPKYRVCLKVNEIMEIEAEDEEEAFDQFQEWFDNSYPQAVEVTEIK